MRSRWPAIAISLSLVAGLTACSSAGAGQTASPGLTPANATAATTPGSTPGTSPGSGAAQVSVAKVEVSPANGKKKVRLDSAVSVTASDGRLVSVTVKSADGTKLKGSISADGTTWRPDRPGGLDAAAKYRVTATAIDAHGLTAKVRSTFTTLTPSRRGTAYLTPGDKWNVGVGMPVVVTLSSPVSKSRRDDVERAISVTSRPATEGAWRWFSDTQLQWRPAKLWKSGTKVSVKARLQGVQFDKGTWGKGTQKASFTIGSRMISTVDMARHTLTVRKNGKVLRVIPITTGKRGFETRNGVKVIMSRETSRQMNSETTGIGRDSAEYYNVNVKWAMRLTYSGEFLHAAPWSVGSQGRANVSHGCTGMSTANAAWLFSVSKVGDVVKYVNGSRGMEWGNGYTAWNMSFDEWAGHRDGKRSGKKPSADPRADRGHERVPAGPRPR